MKLAVCTLACFAATALGQANAGSDAPRAELRHLAELHVRAMRVVEAEKARGQQPLCAKAMTTMDINSCLANELSITDGNYLTLVRAIGAMLRAGDETQASPTRIPFDDAEADWHTYREKACNAVGEQYAGGSIRPSMEMGCQLTIARHHIDELWTVYRELGTH